MISVEEKLISLGIDLPQIPNPAGLYVPLIQTGNLVFLSGQIPIDSSSNPPVVKYTGKVGTNLSIEEGQKSARLCTLNALSIFKNHFGSFSKIKKIIKVTGYVNCMADFYEHPKVINGASELLLHLFEERGKHTRVAIGTNSLPLNSATEIDFIIEIF